jgi:type VI protein secretion system component VasF
MNTRISQTGTEHGMPGAEIEPKQDSKQVSQDALVADIERTREDLARTIDEISDRLSPANAARRAADQARERIAAVDPVMVGAAALAVAAAVGAWLLLRRRKRLGGAG